MIQLFQEKMFPVVQPIGAMGYEVQEQFKQTFQKILKEGKRDIIVDLTHVELITSAGLGIFFTLQKEMDQLGGHLVFVSPKPAVLKAIADWRLDQILLIFPTLSDACNYLVSPAP